jgi:hypothetical protein
LLLPNPYLRDWSVTFAGATHIDLHFSVIDVDAFFIEAGYVESKFIGECGKQIPMTGVQQAIAFQFLHHLLDLAHLVQ